MHNALTKPQGSNLRSYCYMHKIFRLFDVQRVSLWLAVLFLALAVASAACLQLGPSGKRRTPTGAAVPTSTATVTPTREPEEPTRTPVSTATSSPTADPVVTSTRTPTATSFASQAPPSTGFAPPFTPPFGGAPSTSGGGASSGGILPIPGLGGGPGAPVPVSQEPSSWECNGDERMTFLPPYPQVGEEVIITLASSRTHAYTFLYGPTGLLPAGSAGKTASVNFWQWKFTPKQAGNNRFAFYSGPAEEFLCNTSFLIVVEAGAGGGTSPAPVGPPAATATATSTPTATGTPRPDR